jgi:hypothetical protein
MFTGEMRQAALAVAVALVFAGPAAYGQAAHDHGQAAGEVKLVLNQGQKWTTDAPLRQGMDNIRGALAKDVNAIHADKATPKQYEALAAKVTGEVAGIVQNCKLEPAADEQLHLVIAELMAGAEAMEGKVKGETRRAGAERVANALNAYGEHFDHAGWKRL